MTEEIFVSTKVKELGIPSSISHGIFTALVILVLGVFAVFAVVIVIVVFIAELVIIWILTLYILTFVHGIFVDQTLFVTESIFTIPFSDVFIIGTSNPLWFWLVFLMLVLVRIGKRMSEKEKKCKWGTNK